MARRLAGLVRWVKVGSVLFTAAGPDVIRCLRALGMSVMLDLKYLDIPSTVELSCRAAAAHRVGLLTVHTIGGAAMLKAAVRGARTEAARHRATRPLVLGVTVLTSVDGASTRAVQREVLRRATIAHTAGCDGVVASAREAAVLRARFGHRWRIVCPGIRLASSRATSKDDQQRVATPAQALRDGAHWLVVGRPITAAPDPRRMAVQVLSDMGTAGAC